MLACPTTSILVAKCASCKSTWLSVPTEGGRLCARRGEALMHEICQKDHNDATIQNHLENGIGSNALLSLSLSLVSLFYSY